MLRRILQPIRVVTILISMVVFLAHMGVTFLLVRGRWERVLWANRILSYYAAWGLWVLRVKSRVIGAENLAGITNGLYVGNHMSYIDVLIISQRMAASFVTSMEIKETPGLGLICQMAGSVFVERRNKTNIHNEVSELRDGLLKGVNIAIFPEATSTNGEQILRFRKPLYFAAIGAQKPVLPFCLNYRTVGGRPIDRVSRDSICWYGDMDFVPHLWALAGSGGVTADLEFLPPIHPKVDDDAARIAEASQQAVESAFTPIR